MRKLLLGLPMLLAATSANAAEIGGKEVNITVGVDYVDEYVFRGFSFADDSLQPYVEAGIGNFTVGMWANSPMGDDADFGTDEIDLYASYGFELGSSGLAGSIGGTYYHFPEGDGFFDTDGGATGTYEINAGLSLDNVFAPAVTAYYDFTLEAFTIEGSVGYDLVETSDRSSIGLGVTGGFVDANDTSTDDYAWLTASAGWSFELTDDAAFNAGVNYSVNTDRNTLGFSSPIGPDGVEIFENDGTDLFWSGVGFSAGF